MMKIGCCLSKCRVGFRSQRLHVGLPAVTTQIRTFKAYDTSAELFPPKPKVQKPKLMFREGYSEKDRELYTLVQRIDPELNFETVETVFTTDNQMYLPLGNRVIALHVAKYLQRVHPNLPLSCADDVIKYMSLPMMVGQISKTFGVQRLRQHTDPENNTSSSSVFASVIGIMASRPDQTALNKFLDEVFDPRLRGLNLRELIRIPDATHRLQDMYRTRNQNVIFKLLREAGRNSVAPTYYVGAFANGVCIGEGIDRSIPKAKAAAATETLTKIYLEKRI